MENKLQYYMRVIKGASFEKFNKALEEAHTRSGKNKAFLFCDMLNSMARYGAGYNDYVIFEFWNLNAKQRDTYLTRFRSKKLIMFMNDHSYAHIFNNKNEFNEVFKDFIGRECLDLEIATEEDIKKFFDSREKVFAKMKDLTCGIGAELLKTADFENSDAFIQYIREKHFATIEDVIENHPDVAKMYPYSVNTMRMITLVDAKGEPHLLYSVFKMGRDGRVVDNYGVHGPVDLETGEFLYPAHSGDTTAGKHYTEHPNTHQPLLGYKVPYMKEAVEMVKKAALVVPQMRYIGWDVAITPNGPAIIEGNNYCAHDFWQLPGQTPGGFGIMPTIKKIAPEFKY